MPSFSDLPDYSQSLQYQYSPLFVALVKSLFIDGYIISISWWIEFENNIIIYISGFFNRSLDCNDKIRGRKFVENIALTMDFLNNP